MDTYLFILILIGLISFCILCIALLPYFGLPMENAIFIGSNILIIQIFILYMYYTTQYKLDDIKSDALTSNNTNHLVNRRKIPDIFDTKVSINDSINIEPDRGNSTDTTIDVTKSINNIVKDIN